MAAEVEAFCERLGYCFSARKLLDQALTHKSFRNEMREIGPEKDACLDNERLEFLGDAVLDLALSQMLMVRFASDHEGSLSKKRASLVNEGHLSEVAREIGLDQCLQLGKGERQTGGLSKPRILASALEAVLGAVFQDGGYGAAAAVVSRLFAPRLETFANGSADFARDYKTRLQELAQARFKQTPVYCLECENGPDHEKSFEVSVRLGTQVLAVGSGRNKKTAEQDAAQKALERLASEQDVLS